MVIHTHHKRKISFKVVIISALLFVSILQSCHNKEAAPINIYNYYPLAIGQSSIYDITETIYSAGQKDPVVSNWQEKERITSVSTNSSGIPTYLVSVYQKNGASDYWQKVKDYAVEQYPDKIIQNSDNESIIPLIFPIDKNLKWDAYIYLNLKSTDVRYGNRFYYEDVGESFNNGLTNFENTLKVVERVDTSGLTKYNFASKHYAYDVGLVLEQQADFDYLQVNGELVGYKVISSGKRRVKKLIEYSKN